jgi:Rod binding domain-containing protein
MAAITTAQYAQMVKTARDFESMFVARMLDRAGAGLKSKGAFFGGHAEEQFRSVLNDHYGKAVAMRGGLGIADMVLGQMIRMQEMRP